MCTALSSTSQSCTVRGVISFPVSLSALIDAFDFWRVFEFVKLLYSSVFVALWRAIVFRGFRSQLEQ